MKRTPNCTHACRDGQPCGRKVTDGSQPPVCHIHRAKAEGRSNSPLSPTPDDVDPIRILKRLARSSNESTSLKAVDLLLDLEKTKKAEVKGPNYDAFLAVLTDDERTTIRSLHDQLQALRETVYTRCPDLRPASRVPAAPVPMEPATSDEDASTPPRVPTLAPPPPLIVDDVVYRDGVEP